MKTHPDRVDRREYLRIAIPGLKARFNVIPQGEQPPLLAGFERSAPMSFRKEEEDSEMILRLVRPILQRLEDKLDRALVVLEKAASGNQYRYEADIMDICAGGFCMNSGADLSADELLDLCIFPSYGNPRPIFAIGQVIWIEEPGEAGAQGPCSQGVQFLQIDQEDQDSIVRAVFKADRLRREENRQ